MQKLIMSCLIFSFSLFFFASADIYKINRNLGKGINLGNAFEAPSFGKWGEEYDTNYISIIAQKGFQTIRIPVRWCPVERTALDSPYTISETFFAQVDEAVNCALKHNLNVVLDVHHYDTLFKYPDREWNRFKAMWTQIADRYKERPDNLVFEILNEPNTNLTAEKWNKLLAETFPIIRESNKTRPVIIGVAEWGGISALNKLELPQDSNIILTVHYYNPMTFTHQGAIWMDAYKGLKNIKWTGTYYQKKAVIDDIEYIRAYSEKNKVPVFLGEFGAIKGADIESRVKWSSYCARLFEKYDFSWAYWAFGAGFDVYDKRNNKWIDSLADALLSTDTSILVMKEDSIIKENDLIVNGNFADTSNWLLGVWNKVTSEAKGTVADNKYTIEITKSGKNNWDIQLLQFGINLKKDHVYALYFDAYADSERTIHTAIDQYIEATDAYTDYGKKSSTLTKEKQTVLIHFSMPVNDTNARVNFFLGASTPTVHISNVHLYDQGSTSPIKNQVLNNTKSALTYTARLNGQTIALAFGKKVPQPVSIILTSIAGKVIFKADNMIVSTSNSLEIPVQYKSSSPMVLQVKSGALNECKVLYDFN